ncbi:DUF3883 domain-containing protein [Algoriphagus halophilus]|uniref:Uncharacterized protein n=1 Tax=Algoriphagus halophilus TaxID=226505 RepID=A0A1N6E661_9BACT|nr:DUF3427 domain-containing protein [Algoriphagus halophilus]SIN78473.1 protein of unknown function [Algoriphagus halophilus]
MKLIRYRSYSREDIHNIFSPGSNFTPGSGKWGLRGIVSVPNTESDFVFFVTFGTTIAHHTFKEGITEDGILTWQSQPNQSLNSAQIIKLISHDYLKHNVYLLLRTNKSSKYTYLGKLAYESHNPTTEKPVQFQWQITDWEIREDVFNSMGLKLTDFELDADPYTEPIIFTQNNSLVKSAIKPISRKPLEKTVKTKKVTKTDYLKKAERSLKIGMKGELLVLEKEKEKLKSLGINKEVEHKSIKGDGDGYDILSYDCNGDPIFIEVKTTIGGINTPFDISINEVLVANENPDNYYIYRLFNYNENNNSAEYYELNGPISKYFSLEPTSFKAYFNENN